MVTVSIVFRAKTLEDSFPVGRLSFFIMSPPILTRVELDWLQRKTSSTGRREDLKRKFYISQGAVGFSVNALEISWLKKTISGLGGDPSTSKYEADLWKQLVSISGFRVSKNITENKMTFYLNN